jgi:ABC-2 type transport system ATP-binding protein
MAVFVSSHLLSELEQLCDRVLVLRSGRVIGESGMATLLASTGTAPIDVAFTVGSPARAVEVLGGLPDAVVRLDGETVVVTCAREEIPEKVAALVGAGVAVHAVVPSTASLEDRYLQMAGGGGID